MKNYENEVCELYGNNAAYREHEQKTKNYACDERFEKSIDKLGEGTAKFAVEAI